MSHEQKPLLWLHLPSQFHSEFIVLHCLKVLLKFAQHKLRSQECCLSESILMTHASFFLTMPVILYHQQKALLKNPWLSCSQQCKDLWIMGTFAHVDVQLEMNVNVRVCDEALKKGSGVLDFVGLWRLSKMLKWWPDSEAAAPAGPFDILAVLINWDQPKIGSENGGNWEWIMPLVCSCFCSCIGRNVEQIWIYWWWMQIFSSEMISILQEPVCDPQDGWLGWCLSLFQKMLTFATKLDWYENI